MLTCTAIDVLEELPTGESVMNVSLSDGRNLLWIYTSAKAMEFLNKEVIVSTRKDIYKGAMQECIATITIPNIVNVLSQDKDFKLYLDVEDNQSNLSFTEIAVGETRYSSIVYCTYCEFKTSAKAIWQELTIRDKTMHTAKLRVFDYLNNSADFTGTYVLVSLTRTPYGFQTDAVTPMKGEIAPNPEIELAYNYITNYFNNDVVMMSYMRRTALLETLKDYVDYEPGYGLMRLAMELSMVDSMKNITKDVDLKVIGEALACSYGYLCKQSVLSASVNNIFLATGEQWENKKLLLQLLDRTEDEIPERAVFNSIKSTVNTLLEVRKGTA